MKKNISSWILLLEIIAIVAMHANKGGSEKIKDILLKRNHTGLIKATPIIQASVN
ncbi:MULTISPECIES: hypothetical protein [unclassified Flavihumibacter]|uniref:hypothetical protein n=1 Tax=unclassified Flavihumibacter TaxID=2621068 RepID=UPI000A87BC37|nr:hypothetical protein [Flavihumibacter sp. ZG627]MCG7857944.1 hypothetical protein [Flavihumibacter sediminis]